MCLRHLRELLGGSSFYSVRACKREGKGLKFARKLVNYLPSTALKTSLSVSFA